jgi:hypothetical protein
MPVVPVAFADTAAHIFALAQSHLNQYAVTTGQVFTDARLLPFANSAYRWLQRELALAGHKTIVKDEAIEVPAGETTIAAENVAPAPALPVDFIAPWKLREKGSGTSERYVPMSYYPDGPLPDREQGEFLQVWEYTGNQINLIGATRAVTVSLRYHAALPELAAANSPVQIRFAIDPLAAYTAALAAASRGQLNGAQALYATAEAEKQKLIGLLVKPMQRVPLRRRGYGSRFRNY